LAYDDLISGTEGGAFAYVDDGTTTCASDGFTWDIDANNSVEPLEDGLLFIRYLFEFTGDPLVDAAVDMNGERTLPSEIEAFLETHSAAIDIDGDGETRALADGLMVIRYFFGFRDDSLIEGAVSATATRITSDKIEACIEANMP
jgi:hypothetical protein